jgi:nicotinate-nucleotide pyrophosphorylase (carboxylating)
MGIMQTPAQVVTATGAALGASVELRNAIAPDVELEASGNVQIPTLRPIAATGVERISSGALTHQADWLDLGMDFASSD